MKKLHGFFLTLIISFSFHATNAQTSCTGVTVEAFPKSPQSGNYYYYGVRVTLSYTYYQNVTVNGSITEQGGQNVATIFELTVTAGNLTAQTSETFYAASWGGNVVIDVESISPCPSNFHIPYDSIGIIHNITLTTCKNEQSPIDCGVNYIQSLFPGVFDQGTVDDIIDQATYAAVHDSTNYVPESFSSEGQGYSSQLLSLIGDLEYSYQIGQAIDDISELESDILESSLSDFEKKALLYASSTARHSFAFWLGELDTTGSIAMNKISYDSFPSLGSASYYNTFDNELSLVNKPISFHYNDHGSSGSYIGWFRKLLRIVLGDVVGALVGAAVTAVFAEGCAVCPVLGAIIGGFSGSIAAGSAFESP